MLCGYKRSYQDQVPLFGQDFMEGMDLGWRRQTAELNLSSEK